MVHANRTKQKLLWLGEFIDRYKSLLWKFYIKWLLILNYSLAFYFTAMISLFCIPICRNPDMNKYLSHSVTVQLSLSSS